MNYSSENRHDGHGYSFKKKERLCSKKQMEKLFSDGKSFLFYPIKVVYSEIEFSDPFPAKVAFAASKKNFKKAVVRNLIKRRMREAYRLNKQILGDGSSSKKAVFFIYISQQIADYKTIEKAMQKSLATLAKKSIPNP